MDSAKGKTRAILLIDDDRDDFELVQEAIHEIDPDISVLFLSECEQAIQYKHQAFDFVLLDINMPRHDGFFWLQTIRKYREAKLPVIMFTNSASPAHINKAYHDGANLYFSKPGTFSDLKKGLKELINIDWSDAAAIPEKYPELTSYNIFRFT